ncbi:MAG: ABC transporter permease subunit [Rhizobiaceae bacterium]|nr:ABC transporter permease subunit [Rhizobiaceae bacterium]
MSMVEQSTVNKGLFTYRGSNYTVLVLSLLGLLFSLLVYGIAKNTSVFPQAVIDSFPFVETINDAQKWMEENIRHITRAISDAVRVPLEWLEEVLWELPWVFVLLAMVLPALAYGGLRLGLLAVVGVCFWGMVGMWYEAMSTLSLMAVSVSFSVVLGILLGVLSSQSERFEAFLRPILDTMQTMPAFVYLIPAIFFFGVGAPSATLAIIIYAIPPVIRLTSLGIRQVPATMVEAAQSYGSTRAQMLWKVKLPQALPSIMQGVNQTIMMALGLAVLAVFIGGGGLGEQVWKALTKLKVGWAFEGGIAIVFMAIIFDRLSYAVTGVSSGKMAHYGDGPRFYLLPQKWDANPLARAIEMPIGVVWNAFATVGIAITNYFAKSIKPLSPGFSDWLAPKPFLLIGSLILAVVYLIGPEVKWMNSYPRAWEYSIREPIDFAIDWLTINPTFIAVTKFIRSFVFLYLLDPLDKFLVGLPWWYVMAALTLIVWVSTNMRFALTTLVFLIFLAAAGLWEISLFTIAGTAVSVLICIAIGVPLGIVAAYSKITDAVLRPILDAMQTLPAFVYLIPALFFFGGNKTTAIIATVIYSIPPVIRLTTLGLRQLPPEIDEVSNSYGSSTLQTLFMVKLPMASPSIMLGLNQAVVMALAMQAITPLVAGEGLGKEVYHAMNVANMGRGLAAGIGIVLLTIMLDRLTQGWTKNQRRALGL